MAKLKGFFEIVNALTGVSARHNRALAEIKGLSDALQEFLGKYNTPADVFGNTGMAQTEVTTLIYHIRTKVKTFRNIKGKKVLPLTRNVYRSLESVRVDIFNLYVVSESGPKRRTFEITDALKATALLPGGSIIVPSYL